MALKILYAMKDDHTLPELTKRNRLIDFIDRDCVAVVMAFEKLIQENKRLSHGKE